MARRTIWKFTVDPFEPKTTMPEGARILHVHAQSGKARVWALVDPDALLVSRLVHVVPTGVPVPDEVADAVYLGSVHMRQPFSEADVGLGSLLLVFHVFDGGEEKPSVDARWVGAAYAEEVQRR